ncbi:hypothetical protein SAMN03080615_02851 [Amphritea atlantica]|uniref:Uncharacterized protein n=1 Tax=Amphritea atlantica TaxID=355243 RepID=A0A1H9J346_9GAMM|nr:hypothetical protein SAMN03080615_02851 [Amphritea atlantica]
MGVYAIKNAFLDTKINFSGSWLSIFSAQQSVNSEGEEAEKSDLKQSVMRADG